jgi:proton-coupled amino acid transporter
MIKDHQVKKVGKLSIMRTYFTLLKGFICTGILYLPQQFYYGGWGFSAIAMILSYIFTLICALKLMEARKVVNKTSFTEIGFCAYGKTGRILTEVSLAVSQTGFVCAYVYFISS